MYDELTARYTFHCPSQGEVRVPLSDFRSLERLPGAEAPAVFRVLFACSCGGEHEGLVAHDELDWAPVAGSETAFLNLMTARLEMVGAELVALAAHRIQAGEWPWLFFCFPEERPRPVFPSSFRVLTPTDAHDVGVAVACPSCARTSINLVSRQHVDVPFYNDRQIRVVEHLFASESALTLEHFRDELFGAAFDAARRDLAA
jgi:hypothetical protein